MSHQKPRRQNLSLCLRTSLQKADRIAILAVGSDLRADDAAGLLAGRELQRLIGASEGPIPVQVFFGDTTPENLTGAIRPFGPSHLILLDAADLGRQPGRMELFGPERIADSGSFSTHSLPLSVLADYLVRTLGCQVLLLGIQPASREFGRSVTPAVARAARLAARTLFRSLSRSA